VGNQHAYDGVEPKLRLLLMKLKRSVRKTGGFRRRYPRLNENDLEDLRSVIKSAQADYESFEAAKRRSISVSKDTNVKVGRRRPKAVPIEQALAIIEQGLEQAGISYTETHFERGFRWELFKRGIEERERCHLIAAEFKNIWRSPNPAHYDLANVRKWDSVAARNWERRLARERALQKRSNPTGKELSDKSNLRLRVDALVISKRFEAFLEKKRPKEAVLDDLLINLWEPFAKLAALSERHRSQVREHAPFFRFCQIIVRRLLPRTPRSLRALSSRWEVIIKTGRLPENA
jgi:hypothetical protein